MSAKLKTTPISPAEKHKKYARKIALEFMQSAWEIARDRGLTKKQFAEACGMNPVALCTLISGRGTTTPTLASLNSMAKAVGRQLVLVVGSEEYVARDVRGAAKKIVADIQKARKVVERQVAPKSGTVSRRTVQRVSAKAASRSPTLLSMVKIVAEARGKLELHLS